MPGITEISYIENDTRERELADKVGTLVRDLGGIAILREVYFDEYGADGLTPRVNFPGGEVIDGIPAIEALTAGTITDLVS